MGFTSFQVLTRQVTNPAAALQPSMGTMTLRTIALVLLLPGCSVLGDKRVAAGCQVADGMTTYYALKHGAVEANPLLDGISPGAILLLKLAFAYFIWKAFPEPEHTDDGTKFALGAVTLLGCVPAVNNYNVIKKLP